jgi:fructuronate reductase
VSCDNVAGNGRVLEAVVRGMAEAAAPDLLPWIDDHVAFPTTVVDRIVPATSAEDLLWIEERIGLRDEAAVFGEPFRQWVIEDSFRADRPAWEEAGANIVRDATPHVAIKMRVLNGAQTMLSLLGALVGHEFSWQAAADPVLRGFVRRALAEETLPHLPPAPDLAGQAYLDTSLQRIANPAIRHRCHQIATDTSQKIRPRLLDPIRARRAAGLPAVGLEAGVAAWLAYVAASQAGSGARWTVDDPVMSRLLPLPDDINGLATKLLGQEDVFGTDLARDEGFRARVTTCARALLAGDMARALARA